MSFHPAQYLGLAAPHLAADLAHLRSAPLPAEWEGEIELHSATVAEWEPCIHQPGTLLATTVAEADLPADHPEVTLPGVVLETYLGGGGQGWVYAGRVLATNHLVAVKVLRRGTLGRLGPDVREAILCARVRHRNILRVFQVQPAGMFQVVLMELIQGRELGTEPLSRERVKACFGQLADALGALAAQRIVHCDVKPANVLLRDGDHSPVLVDFGVARDLASGEESPGLYGTPYYMPPEVFRGAQPHPAWDAYSLGITALVTLLGHAAGKYGNVVGLSKAKVSGRFERELRDRLDGLADVELRDWIGMLTHAEPAPRLDALDAARRWLAA